MAEKVRQYVAIDAKSFYASVECVERHLNPLTTNLVVADESRTEKTICLAVSPALKAHGVPGRPRLFEVIQRVRDVNRERMNAGIRLGAIKRNPETKRYQFSSASFDAEAIESDPTLEVSYIIAPPRMRLYEEYSSRIYATYLKYVAPEDIIVYSIDEVFIDVTNYLHTYGMTAHEMTMTMVRDVLYNTGITATAGIGTNLFLAKVAMDIVAKKAKPDKDGVRIAALDEMSFREILWTHRPLTDFWRIGGGTAARLEAMQLFTLGDVARASLDAIMETVLELYDRVVHKDLLIRRVNIAACNLISEDDIPEDKPLQLDMFTDYEAVDREKKAQQAAEEKERKLQRVTLAIQDKFGKNAMLKGMNLMEGGTTIDRNGQIGGHKAGDE